MPLRGPRFAGDPVLEECFAGLHRMLAPEMGIGVKRVQSALMALGRDVGPEGADGTFGRLTGAAVSDYKAEKGLTPTDPVVGPGTSRALDDDLFFDPPERDPAFGDFAPFVAPDLSRPHPRAKQRVESFVALELLGLAGTIRRAVLQALGDEDLLGIVLHSRRLDLVDRYAASAAPIQPDGTSAVELFDRGTAAAESSAGATIAFSREDGSRAALILVSDATVLSRAVEPITLGELLEREIDNAVSLG
jgi:Putative peptidoglycan binding domain